MTCLPSRQRVASIAVGNLERKHGRRQTDGTQKGRLSVLRGENAFTRLQRIFPRGLPISVIPSTVYVSVVLGSQSLVIGPTTMARFQRECQF